MQRPMAERVFGERVRQLQQQIDELPVAEMLRLAAMMLENGGVERRLVIAVVERAGDKLRASA